MGTAHEGPSRRHGPTSAVQRCGGGAYCAGTAVVARGSRPTAGHRACGGAGSALAPPRSSCRACTDGRATRGSASASVWSCGAAAGSAVDHAHRARHRSDCKWFGWRAPVLVALVLVLRCVQNSPPHALHACATSQQGRGALGNLATVPNDTLLVAAFTGAGCVSGSVAQVSGCVCTA